LDYFFIHEYEPNLKPIGHANPCRITASLHSVHDGTGFLFYSGTGVGWYFYGYHCDPFSVCGLSNPIVSAMDNNLDGRGYARGLNRPGNGMA
jgi:hypothetical protein